jgi:hypothetical protein
LKNKSEKDPTLKLLKIPGIKEAIDLVKLKSLERALDKAIEAGEAGEFGVELQHLFTDDSGVDNIDKFFRDNKVDIFIGDETDEHLEDLAFKAGPKISELWGLSEPAGERLIDIIYWGKNRAVNSYLEPFTFILKPPPSGIIDITNKGKIDLLHNAVIRSPQEIQEGHIYLDVTYLPYGSLRRAYKDILLTRDCLGIHSRDLREGAPESIDTDKALKISILAATGKISKKKIQELGFKIYTNDNPSGSYPLYRKYLKFGREIEQKLKALEDFIEEDEK